MKKYILIAVAVFIVVSGVFCFNRVLNGKSNNNKECTVYDQTNPDWVPDFQKYFAQNDMKAKVDNLKQGLDEISVQYIDKYMDNTQYWDKCTNLCPGYDRRDRVSDYDKKLFNDLKNVPYENPYDIELHIFMYKNLYGMRDLPKSVLDNINGKEIIDVGAYTGDTAYMFYKYFPKSKIYAYEPIIDFYVIIELLVQKMKEREKQPVLIIPVCKGLGNQQGIETTEYYGKQSTVRFSTIDAESKELKLNNIGLIKADVEGVEAQVIEGAKEVIATQKPVLVFAIYHTPEDFFDLKDKIKAINPDYKFMIRRSEDILADADLVLIAY